MVSAFGRKGAMSIKVSIRSSMNIEVCYEDEIFKIFLGFPHAVFMMGDDISQQFKSRYRDINIHNIHKEYPSRQAIEASAQQYKGGTLDHDGLMHSIDKLIKEHKLLLRDKTFVKRLLNSYKSVSPESFKTILIQNGYAHRIESLKYKTPDSRLDKTCRILDMAIKELPRAIKELRLEETSEERKA